MTTPSDEHTTPHFVAGACVCCCVYCTTRTGKCICLECPQCEKRLLAALAEKCEWCGAVYDDETLCRHPSLN